MNSLQRMVLAIGLLVVCVSVVFIPYEASYRGNSSNIIARAPAGYAFLAAAPSNDQCVVAIEKVRQGRIEPNRCSTRIDTTRIALQLGALATLVTALTLLAGVVRRREPGGDRSGSQPMPSFDSRHDDMETLPPAMPRAKPPGRSTFVDHLRRAMPGLPVSRGDLNEHTPLVITEDVNHVSVEYQVMDFIIQGDRAREYRKTGQQLLNRGGQRIDMLTYVTRPVGAKDWSDESVSYYFDITAGFKRMQASLEN